TPPAALPSRNTQHRRMERPRLKAARGQHGLPNPRLRGRAAQEQALRCQLAAGAGGSLCLLRPTLRAPIGRVEGESSSFGGYQKKYFVGAWGGLDCSEG